ncbi:uncharacterized protein LOC100184738 [Ciona intestinalis]
MWGYRYHYNIEYLRAKMCESRVNTSVGTFYFNQGTSANFSEAIKGCEDKYQSKLALINSVESMAAARESLKAESCRSNFFWIGLSREGGSSAEHKWIDGTTFDPSIFGDIGGTGTSSQCIGTLINKDGGLSTFLCSEKIPYLCYSPISESTTTAVIPTTTQSATSAPELPVGTAGNVGLAVGLSFAFILLALLIAVVIALKKRNLTRQPMLKSPSIHQTSDNGTTVSLDSIVSDRSYVNLKLNMDNHNEVYSNSPKKQETGIEYSTLNNVERSATSPTKEEIKSDERKKIADVYTMPIKRNKHEPLYTTIT